VCREIREEWSRGRAGITAVSRLNAVVSGNSFFSANKTSSQPESGSESESWLREREQTG